MMCYSLLPSARGSDGVVHWAAKSIRKLPSLCLSGCELVPVCRLEAQTLALVQPRGGHSIRDATARRVLVPWNRRAVSRPEFRTGSSLSSSQGLRSRLWLLPRAWRLPLLCPSTYGPTGVDELGRLSPRHAGPWQQSMLVPQGAYRLACTTATCDRCCTALKAVVVNKFVGLRSFPVPSVVARVHVSGVVSVCCSPSRPWRVLRRTRQARPLGPFHHGEGLSGVKGSALDLDNVCFT